MSWRDFRLWRIYPCSSPDKRACRSSSGICELAFCTLRRGEHEAEPLQAKRKSIRKGCSFFFGRSGGTRTRGLQYPKLARYQLRYTSKMLIFHSFDFQTQIIITHLFRFVNRLWKIIVAFCFIFELFFSFYLGRGGVNADLDVRYPDRSSVALIPCHHGPKSVKDVFTIIILYINNVHKVRASVL